MANTYGAQKVEQLPRLLSDETYLDVAVRYWSGRALAELLEYERPITESGISDTFLIELEEELDEQCDGRDCDCEDILEEYESLADVVEQMAVKWGQSLMNGCDPWNVNGGDTSSPTPTRERLEKLSQLRNDETYLEKATRYWSGRVLVEQPDSHQKTHTTWDRPIARDGIAETFLNELGDMLDAFLEDEEDDTLDKVIKACSPLANKIEKRVVRLGKTLLKENCKKMNNKLLKEGKA